MSIGRGSARGPCGYGAAGAFQSGFTLIEMAVVLAIIAVMTVSVLQGRELIANAEYSRFKRTLSDHVQAFELFRERYDGLPGDYDDSAAQADLGPAGGNGNGVISGPCDSVGAESCRAWQHLRAAALIRGDSNQAGEAASPEHTYGDRIDGFFTGTDGNGEFGHKLLMLGVPAAIARRLDDEIDDGLCNDGRVSSSDCKSSDEWPDEANGPVDLIYAL